MQFLPQPPTDNLYKFIAIAGLLVSALGGTFAYVSAGRIDATLVAIEGRVAEDSLEVRYVREDAADTSLTRAERLRRARDVERRVARRGAEVAALRKTYDGSKWTLISCVLWIFIGMAIAFKGFQLWYIRLQQFQDEIVSNEARERRAGGG